MRSLHGPVHSGVWREPRQVTVGQSIAPIFNCGNSANEASPNFEISNPICFGAEKPPEDGFRVGRSKPGLSTELGSQQATAVGWATCVRQK